MQEHIFAPLGISSVTMFPDEKMQSNLAYMHQRDPATGALSERDHLYRRALKQTTKEQQQAFFHSAGAGLFAKPKEYIKVMLALMNGGESPQTGNRILKKETVDLMWENQIPDQPDFARGGKRCPISYLASPPSPPATLDYLRSPVVYLLTHLQFFRSSTCESPPC